MVARPMSAGCHEMVAAEEPRKRGRSDSFSLLGLLRSVIAAAALIVLIPAPGVAQGKPELERDAQSKLNKLVASVPLAKRLSKEAVAVLVFPKITKAGFVIGGQYGEGVLFRRGKPAGYYNTTGVSYGLQAGAQLYGYAMFFMNEAALRALDRTDGFEVGVGPSVVVVDQGMGKSMTSKTLTSDAYAFIFSQQGLMAGVGLQGSKITRLGQ